MNVVDYINKKATWTRVIILFCTSAILATCIITMFFGQLNLNSEATMDSLSFYTSDTFFKNLDLQGEAGRQSYIILHLIDYLFITQFYFFFVFLINLLVRRLTDRKLIGYICLIPVLSGLMDLLENISIDISILIYPRKFIFLGNLAGIFTFIKMYSIYLLFTIILVFSVLVTIKAVKNRKK